MGIHLNLTIDLTFHQNSIPERNRTLVTSITEAESTVHKILTTKEECEDDH